MDDLSNIESVVVLGASRGIGKAVAERLSQCGVKKLHLVSRNLEALEELAKTLEASCVLHSCDLLDDQACQSFIHELEDLGEFPRNWIFCAGGFPGGRMHTTSYERHSWEAVDAMLNLNLRMPMKLTHLIVPELLRDRREGSLIYISSQSGYFARPGLVPYAASKFGLNGFVKSIFPELRENGVKVSIVAPGYVDTPLIPDSPNLDKAKMIHPEDVAKTVSCALGLSATCCPLEFHLLTQQQI
ncbi:SDR family oxidoreductase [bacterium]|nr:SDR family oxidoreductase [bacterium]